MKTLKFSLVLCSRENTDVFIVLYESVYGIPFIRANILCTMFPTTELFSPY